MFIYAHLMCRNAYGLCEKRSRPKTPPSRGKLVLNTPFLAAGVPASIETRRIYGTYAGGRRIYFMDIKQISKAIRCIRVAYRPSDLCEDLHLHQGAAHVHESEARPGGFETGRILCLHRRVSWELSGLLDLSWSPSWSQTLSAWGCRETAFASHRTAFYPLPWCRMMKGIVRWTWLGRNEGLKECISFYAMMSPEFMRLRILRNI